MSKHDPRAERRSGRDRRRAEAGPPGVAERRRAVEPRLPETVELDMSVSQWQSLSQGGDAGTGTGTRSAPEPASPAPRPPRSGS